MTHTTSRSAAINTLCAWQQSHKPIDIYFNQEVSSLPQQEKNLTKSIVFGVLRQQQSLDAVIEKFSSHPLKKMKPRTHATLQVGVYQLLFFDRIPDSAAVNETVKTLKKAKQPQWLIRFVNGLLRSVARHKNTLPASLSSVHDGGILNHPQWLTARWEKTFGREKTKLICQQNNQEPVLTLRVNTSLITRTELQEHFEQKGIIAAPGQFSDESLLLQSPGSISELPGYQEGWFQIQDQSAQLASRLFPPFTKGQHILDCCAGLGGKTTHLAQLSPTSCEISVIEPDTRRFALLKENITRLQLNNTFHFHLCSLEAFTEKINNTFDAIFLDAPCSGTGVIRRQPDIRWNRQAEDLLTYQDKQCSLLLQASSLLKENGRLIYATCSLEPEENEQVIDGFLRSHQDFHLNDAKLFLPPSAHILCDERGFFHPSPSHGIDGFFAACLSRSVSL